MSKKSNASKGRKFWRRLGKVILILFAISILLPILYRWVNPPVTTFQLVQAVSNGTGIHKKWVPIEKISPYMYRAAIASEDNYFLGHNGFDVIALNTVMEERKSGRRKRGGSTISQQTAKNVFCWPKSSWVRKGVETYFTFLIETFWSKERIMEVYLNVIEMGPGIYGAEKAAQTYFNCHASQLTAHQAALITACYPNPQKRNPAHPTAYLQGRAANIEGKMARYGTPKFTKEYISHVRERYLKSVEKMEQRKKKQQGKKKKK
ncbi:MAG: monofunctional biosynthetic peptidoglycan transglycosylase [Bacteroidales bacterium]|nr:monofunctional biosynthetic peptidoglycan transglycosylase [Bacteroidales bacterium]